EMATLVTLDIFSGRPNPTWLLSDQESAAVAERVHALQEPTQLSSSGVLGSLGYRGFVVSPVGSEQLHSSFHVHEGIVDKGIRETNFISRDRELESYLLETARDAVPNDVKSHLEAEIRKPVAQASSLFSTLLPPKCPRCVAADAPQYNPALWNIPSVQPYNNC